MAKIQNEHRCGWVALMGPPNAGKSTLLNALLGQKISIVTSKPQTTRSRVVGIMSEPGAQVIFMDTPGVNHSRQQQRGHLSKMMSQAAWQSMAAAHAVMLVLDAELDIRRPEFPGRSLNSNFFSRFQRRHGGECPVRRLPFYRQHCHREQYSQRCVVQTFFHCCNRFLSIPSVNCWYFMFL